MMKPFALASVVALALACAACASPSDEAATGPQEAPAAEASTTTAEDSGFNLMMPGGDLDAADDGWNLGIATDMDAGDSLIPDGVVEDRLTDVAEIETSTPQLPEISTDLPKIEAEPEDDLIRLD